MSKQVSDLAQRQQAIDISKSILLQAPAGSGKTELLSQRILALLAVVKKPEQILALTFTNKAAEEMRTRVIENLLLANAVLSQSKSLADFEDYQQQTIKLAQHALNNSNSQSWDLINNPGRLQIKTIDSFSLFLVQRMPLLSKTGGLENICTASDEIYHAAVNNALAVLENDNEYSDAVEQILEFFANDYQKLKDLLQAMLKKRDQWRRLDLFSEINSNSDQQMTNLQSAWENYVEQQISQLDNIPSSIIEQLNKFTVIAQNNLGQSSINAQLGENIFNNVELVKHWQQLLLTKEGELRKQITKNQGFPAKSEGAEHEKNKNDFLEFLQEIKQMPKVLEVLKSTIPIPKITQAQFQSLLSLIKVLDLCLAHLNIEFINKAELDFTEISIRALQALAGLDEISDLGLYLDNNISHILVDEFQDTNHLQLKLFELLTREWQQDGNKTFFAVGDPMQSIFRFREADVGLFLDVKNNGINGFKLKFLQLSVNFRSNSQIVDWVNKKFVDIFPKLDNQLEGAVSYSESVAFNQQENGEVQFFGFTDKSQEIATIIEVIKKQNTEHSIGLLLRKKADLLDISLALKKAQIAFNAVEMDSLSSIQIVKDVQSLIHGFCHLKNKAAWLEILRAPWCGMTLVDLQSLVDIDQNETIWQLLQLEEQWLGISPSGVMRLKFIKNVFKRAFALATQFPLVSLLRKLCISLGVDKLIKNEYEKIAIETIFKTVAQNMENGSLNIERLDQDIDLLFAPATTTNAKLECMTIHKSKGLEFDTVLLPQLNSKSKSNSKMLIHWEETTAGLLVAPINGTYDEQEPELHNYLSNLAKDKDEHEVRRLLYVACTRAKQNMYLFASVKPNKKGDLIPNKNSFLAYLWQGVQEKFPPVEADTSAQESAQPTKIPVELIRFADNFYHKRTIEYQPISTYKKPELTFAENEQKQIGNIYHLCCEYLVKEDLDNLNLVNLQQFVVKLVKQKGLDFEHSKKIMQLLENTLEDKTGRWILTNHQQDWQEWSLLIKQNTFFKNYIIDRCFVDKDIFWLIDYKTSAPKDNENLDDFKARMKNDYQQQLLDYQKAVTGLIDYPIKKMLYLPAISYGLLLY